MRISDWSSDVCSSDLRNKGELGICNFDGFFLVAMPPPRFDRDDHRATAHAAQFAIDRNLIADLDRKMELHPVHRHRDGPAMRSPRGDQSRDRKSTRLNSSH